MAILFSRWTRDVFHAVGIPDDELPEIMRQRLAEAETDAGFTALTREPKTTVH